MLLALFIAIAALAAWYITARNADDWEIIDAAGRIARARKARAGLISERFKAAGVAYPPREIFLRAFKHEAALELWARDNRAAFTLVATYPILASSGVPGPKRREGDRQVPEGFYRVDRFNPMSAYHLSLGLDYPNAADLRRSDAARPGGDIFIHGKAVTIGCIPIGDSAIEELFLIALDARDADQRDVSVHIFPARMSGPDWEIFLKREIARDPALAGFWQSLRPDYEAFERDHRTLEKAPIAVD